MDKEKRVWISSDYHFGHKNILKYCRNRHIFLTESERRALNAIQEKDPNDFRAIKELPVSEGSIELMNKTIIDNVNSVVGEKDMLYILGDFCFCRNDAAQVFNYRKQIRCQEIHLLKGNHDRSCVKSPGIFSSVKDYDEIYLDNMSFVLFHYPLLSWNKMHYGNTIHCFGHCHSNMNPWLKQHLPDAKMLDVGIDSHDYKPWSAEEIIDHFKGQKNNSFPDCPNGANEI